MTGERDDRLLIAAALSLLAGVVHALLAPAHFDEATWLGVAFVLAAGGQLLWAALAVSGRRVMWFALAVNLGCVACWAISRTIGLPGQEVEAAGVTDVLTGVAELALCAIVVGVRGARRPGLVSAAVLVCLVTSGMVGH